VLIADDPVTKWGTHFTVLDYDTVAVVDKFENFYVLRVPADFNEDVEEEAHRFEVGKLNAAYYKLDTIANFYLGDLAVRLQKGVLAEGCSEVLMYATTMGALGVLLPIVSSEDLEFAVHLEMFMR
jgi:splicing factor 3B subunit 3